MYKYYTVDTPLTPANPPLSLKQLRGKFPREIDIRDIDYKNTELLTKFLNPAGKIKNRYQNRLKDNVQTKIEKAIKQARQMQLLPTNSAVKASDKMSLSSLANDVQMLCRRAIDPNTGRLYSYSNLLKTKQTPDITIEIPKTPPYKH